MQSPSWDGRLGIVVQADIAVYEKGPARPTGGASAVALLIAPNAKITVGNKRVTFMEHVYDFYKPNVQNEYPVVDGKLSIDCYLNAVDNCQSKMQQIFKAKLTESFDYYCFHTPFSKMVQKSLIRLCENEKLD
jgi:hydroxymethylglutaryl-CoA synthase